MKLKVTARPEVFFDLFQQSAANLREAAELLLDLTSDYRDIATKVHRIQERDHDAEEITRAAIQRLNTTFVTPMDREDIHALATALDDVIDEVEQTAAMFELHRIEEPLPEMKVQAEVFVDAVREIEAVFDKLPSMASEQLEPHRLRVAQLEKDGDRIYRQAVADLFSGEHGAMDVLKWTDVISGLESAVDGVARVVDVVESIVVKHA